jgi:hypothetical protein
MNKPITTCPICDKQLNENGTCPSGKNKGGHFYNGNDIQKQDRVSFEHKGEDWDILIEWRETTGASMTVWLDDETYDVDIPNLHSIDWKNLGALAKLVKENWKPVLVTCSNTKCGKSLGTLGDHEGHEMGTPWGYADDYTFCDECAPEADKNFDIACAHTDGPGGAAECLGKDDVIPPIPHTCKYTEAEREAAKLAFKHYR